MIVVLVLSQEGLALFPFLQETHRCRQVGYLYYPCQHQLFLMLKFAWYIQCHISNSVIE